MRSLRVIPLLLWEAWRLTWQSLLLRSAIVSLIAVVIVYMSRQRADANAEIIFLFGVSFLVAMQAFVSSLYAKFGQDRPGFPFYLGYTRPVPTWLLVLVPLGYFALAMAAMYFIPVALLMLVFDAQLPLLTGSLLIGLIAVIGAACNWWSADKLQRGVGWVVAYVAVTRAVFGNIPVSGGRRGDGFEYMMSAIILDFPGLIVAAFVAAGLAVYGVGKQRHGEAIRMTSLVVPGTRKGSRGSLPGSEYFTSLEWLKRLYTGPCPTHSPVAAETWREMKNRGVPVIAAGVLVSILVPILWFAINLTARSLSEYSPGNPAPQAAGMLSLWTILPVSLPFFIATVNLFGVGKKQGRVDMSKFDATLPITTFHQLSLRLLVALGSLFAALGIIITVLWFAMPLVEDVYDYAAGRAAMAALLDSMTWFEILRTGFVYLLVFITVVVSFGILQLLWAMYTRRILYGVALFLVYLVLLAVGIRNELITVDFAVNHLWLIIGAVIGLTGFVIVDVLRRSVMLPLQIGVLFGVCLLFIPAFLSGWISSGVLNLDLPVIVIAWFVMLSLLPLTAMVLAPWTVARFRNK